MEPLVVRLQTLNGKHAELALKGELDVGTCDTVRDQLVDLVDKGATDIVLDLADLSFLDSSGLRGLIEGVHRGAQLRLRHLQPAVQLVFDIVEIPGVTVER
ncbi:MAG TPA: STAS domain-containing protein [Acidimicrobiales bacterium]|nr:STAS domain-containing protein [Acidimicrobiales bacterium]